ncbi:MAG: malonyl-CoA decarboxylase [Pseudomonadota bacterium]
MSTFSDLLMTVFDRRVGLSVLRGDDTRPMEELAEALIGTSGEDTGRDTGQRILERYASLDADGKRAFFHHLATKMDIDPDAVRAALSAYEAEPTKQSYRAFMTASEPRRQEFFRRLNRVPGATERLVRMRADLLDMLRDEPALAALDLDLRHLLSSWFNQGFLVLRPISWQSPALVLEKIIAYEAVHEIESWKDLRRRVEPADRRCFAFFHPAMPDEPLIFVEVALTKGVPGSVQALLSEDRDALLEEDADTAVFYSISNCQAGLAGISFGNSLIKQVVADLSLALPGLKTFVTLSPIPGLARWAEEEGVVVDQSTDLRALAAHYLLGVKRGDGQPLDPVARFHLGNGAQVHAVHAGADTSGKGQGQSFGTMVNYLYDLRRVSQNHESFAAEDKIAASSDVRSLSAAGLKSLRTTSQGATRDQSAL